MSGGNILMTQTADRIWINFGPIGWREIMVVLAIIGLLSACSPGPTKILTPTPTSTRPARSSANENVETLNAVQAALNDIEFGFAPLLLQDEARVVIETRPDGQVARLAYPRQPADPTAWPAVDSFVLAYAVRQTLLDSPQVRWVILGNFDLNAPPLGGVVDSVNHTAVWITFVDYSQAVVDLSPLASNFAARHPINKSAIAPPVIEEQYATWREGVLLDQWQPMKVVRQDGEIYYLLAQVLVFHDRYEFFLRVHPVQMADPMKPLRLLQGTQVSLAMDREGFEETQKFLADGGPTIFHQEAELLIRQGDNSQMLNAMLDDHLHLLWHLATKFEHQPFNPALVPSVTPTVTPTPTPSPTPTPTPTPESATPLLVS
jgi:hypothetical protein